VASSWHLSLRESSFRSRRSSAHARNSGQRAWKLQPLLVRFGFMIPTVCEYSANSGATGCGYRANLPAIHIRPGPRAHNLQVGRSVPLVYRIAMSILRCCLVLCFVSLFATSSSPRAEAQPASLKLIPIPREMTAGAVQPLSSGVQVNCNNPCSPEDSFAVNDFKSWLGSVGVTVNTSSSVNILVARYGTPLANSIYTDSVAASLHGTPAATQMPDEMKA